MKLGWRGGRTGLEREGGARMKLGWRGGRTGLEREGGARMKLGWRGGRTGLEREGVGKSEDNDKERRCVDQPSWQVSDQAEAVGQSPDGLSSH